MQEAWMELKNRAETELKSKLGGIPVFGEGNLQARIMLVGEAPGQEETHLGRPFVGRAGKNLDGLLAAIGLERSTLYISNAVKVRPVKVNSSGRASNRPPTSEEIEICLPFLLEEIRMVTPKVVVTLGNVPLKALCGKDKTIGKVHGTLVEAQWPTFPLYHPASIIYNRALIDVFKEDLEKFAAFLRQTDPSCAPMGR